MFNDTLELYNEDDTIFSFMLKYPASSFYRWISAEVKPTFKKQDACRMVDIMMSKIRHLCRRILDSKMTVICINNQCHSCLNFFHALHVQHFYQCAMLSCTWNFVLHIFTRIQIYVYHSLQLKFMCIHYLSHQENYSLIFHLQLTAFNYGSSFLSSYTSPAQIIQLRPQDPFILQILICWKYSHQHQLVLPHSLQTLVNF